MSQLSADCLNEIFEYLGEEKDIVTLHSCLLVNRLWCKVSVRILWKDGWTYSASNYRTLIACLPNESKEILYKNGLTISTPTSKSPMFNYAAFCKVLSIGNVHDKIKQLLETQSISSPNLNNVVKQEIYKLFINQISSLKVLDYFNHFDISIFIPNITSYLGVFNKLLELNCFSNTCTEFFYQLSKICHKIRKLHITFNGVISNGLTDLISVQQNLKYLTIYDNCYNYFYFYNVSYHGISLKLPNTLIELNLIGECYEQLSSLQYATFPQLQNLKIQYARSRFMSLIRFLENNGKNLKEFYVGESDESLNLAIAKFCTNLRKLSTGFKNNESETLKIIFNSCQYLESIKILCGDQFLNGKEELELVVKYSQEHFCELTLRYPYLRPGLLPEELESFFSSWNNHKQNKSLALTIMTYVTHSYFTMKEVIEKYTIKLGVVKKFEVVCFGDDEYFNKIEWLCFSS